MDDDGIATIVIFAIIMVSVFAGISFYASSIPPTPHSNLQLYADSNMTVPIQGNSIWWRLDAPGYMYSKSAYLYNPNDFSETIVVDWTAYPQERIVYFNCSSSNSQTILPKQMVEVTLYISMRYNTMVSTMVEGDVLTAISGVEQK